MLAPIARALRADPSVPRRATGVPAVWCSTCCWSASGIHRRSSTSATARGYLNALRRADQGDCGSLGELLARAVLDNLYKFIVPAARRSRRGWLPLPALATEEISADALRVARVAWPRRGVEGSGRDVAKLSPLGESVPPRSPSSTQAGRAPATDGTRAARRGRADRVAAARLTCAPASRAKELQGLRTSVTPRGRGHTEARRGAYARLLDEQFERPAVSRDVPCSSQITGRRGAGCGTRAPREYPTPGATYRGPSPSR